MGVLACCVVYCSHQNMVLMALEGIEKVMKVGDAAIAEPRVSGHPIRRRRRRLAVSAQELAARPRRRADSQRAREEDR